jgi:hypothetical protein
MLHRQEVIFLYSNTWKFGLEGISGDYSGWMFNSQLAVSKYGGILDMHTTTGLVSSV